MKKAPKKFLHTFCVLISIIAIILGINKILLLEDNRILKGYYKEEDYSEPHCYRDYADYYKYYYNAESDANFQKSKKYSKVKNTDIKEIKSYFDNFKKWMEAGNRITDYDFEESIIDENDYFIINNKVDMNERLQRKKFDYYDVFLYDTNSHILYAIYVNT